MRKTECNGLRNRISNGKSAKKRVVSPGFPKAHQGPTELLFPQDELPVEIGGEDELPTVGGMGQGTVRVHRLNDSYM